MEQIEGMPEGFEALRIGVPKIGEWYLNARSGPTECKEEAKCEWLILKKIEKPKQYRPFNNAEEFEPHRDRWFRPKTQSCHYIKTIAYDDRGHYRGHWVGEESDTWEEMFAAYVFEDGTPFGVEVNE